MVSVEEVEEVVLPSEERILDAIEIEKMIENVSRPSAKMHLESLTKKLRKEAEALQRLEKNRTDKVTAPAVAEEEKKETAGPPRPAPATVPTGSSAPPPLAPGATYTPIDKFSFDTGGYDSQFVTIYVPLAGSIPKDQVSCRFTKDSFDLIVQNLNGKSYRLFKDNLEHEIDSDKCKYIVKAEKVLVKLAKKKQDYGGYEYWSKLVDNKAKKVKSDPGASIMDLMKDMYDQGDDQMKKMIGETMMKQRRGELGDGPSLDDKF